MNQIKKRDIRAAESFLDTLGQLMPEDPDLLNPFHWHSDLYDGNTLANPNDPTEVTAIMDWQSIEIAPMLVQAAKPAFIAHRNPQAIGLDRPQFPSGSGSLPKYKQRRVQGLWLKQSLVVLYDILISQHCSELWQCVEY